MDKYQLDKIQKHIQNQIQFDYKNKYDKCKYYEDLFIICMKQPIQYPQKDRCKKLFEIWFKCAFDLSI
jgi:hypothetical protein